jgi:hypothetical protein
MADMKFKSAYPHLPTSTLAIDFNLLGVAIVVGWEKDKECGCVLSPTDARSAAAELIRLADEVETYGTAVNPITCHVRNPGDRLLTIGSLSLKG